jgi:adenylylsulfate kinase
MKENIVWHKHIIDRHFREKQQGHKSCVLWFTGLSGSGKSSIASIVEQQLAAINIRTYILDGDNIRHGLNKDLCFSDESRIENIRRVGEVSKLLCDAGSIVLSAFISPFECDRKQVKDLLGDDFIEVFIDTPLDVCESRDPKGLYKKVRAGELKDFTGIDSNFDIPITPHIHIKTAEHSIEQCAKQIIDYLQL